MRNSNHGRLYATRPQITDGPRSSWARARDDKPEIMRAADRAYETSYEWERNFTA